MNRNTCCFFGHRKIDITSEMRCKLYNIIKKLVINEGIDTFLFGSKSQFDKLCYQIISKLKAEYPHIKRIYVRAQFPYIDNDYMSYLLENYEETYFPDNMLKAGRASYVERNYEMINKSEFCILYFDKNYLPPRRKKSNKGLTDYQPKSGTRIAYDYAVRKQRKIINIFNETG